MDEIPASETAAPRALSGPLDALRRRLGITDEQMAAVAFSDGEPFVSHAEWERQQPPVLKYAQQLEAARRTRWQLRHGSLDGYQPRREFPCPGQLRVQDDAGVVWPCVCDVCGYEVGVQVQRIDPERFTERRYAKAGLEPLFVGREFEATQEQDATLRACRQWLRGFKREPLPAIALYGFPGRGKSHLLTLMAEVLIKKHGVDVLYRSAIDLFDELQQGFDSSAYETRWRRVLSVPVLIVDDVGAGRDTAWRRDRFASLVDHRYTKALPLLIATNVPPPAWENRFGPRTASRLAGMCVRLHLDGPDRRAQGVQQTLATEAA